MVLVFCAGRKRQCNAQWKSVERYKNIRNCGADRDHSGPVNQVRDVNDRSNLTGAGINTAQRVMDCGNAGHVLLSKRVAEDLAHYRQWQPFVT